jgi:hypothetical protein
MRLQIIILHSPVEIIIVVDTVDLDDVVGDDGKGHDVTDE